MRDRKCAGNFLDMDVLPQLYLRWKKSQNRKLEKTERNDNAADDNEDDDRCCSCSVLSCSIWEYFYVNIGSLSESYYPTNSFLMFAKFKRFSLNQRIFPTAT